MSNISLLLGRIIDKVVQNENESIDFYMQDGAHYRMYHHQDCCESVSIEEVYGDLQDLVGAPVLRAEERSNRQDDSYGGDEQWTFYEISTINGGVTIRWYGTSNGYYGTSVDFEVVTQSAQGKIAESSDDLQILLNMLQLSDRNGNTLQLDRWECRRFANALETLLEEV